MAPPNIPSTACRVHSSTRLPRGELQLWVALAQRPDRRAEQGREGLEHPLAGHRYRRELGDPASVERPRERRRSRVTSGRSRLLYWRTRGMCTGSSSWARRLTIISRRLSTFSCQRSVAEFATKAIPSAPSQDHATGHRVHGLARDRQQLKLQLVAAEAARAEGEQIAQDGAVLLGVDRDELSLARAPGPGRRGP